MLGLPYPPAMHAHVAIVRFPDRSAAVSLKLPRFLLFGPDQWQNCRSSVCIFENSVDRSPSIKVNATQKGGDLHGLELATYLSKMPLGGNVCGLATRPVKHNTQLRTFLQTKKH